MRSDVKRHHDNEDDKEGGLSLLSCYTLLGFPKRETLGLMWSMHDVLVMCWLTFHALGTWKRHQAIQAVYNYNQHLEGLKSRVQRRAGVFNDSGWEAAVVADSCCGTREAVGKPLQTTRLCP